jgi:hypothetical protein
VCDKETSKTRRLKPATGLWQIQPKWVVTPGKQKKTTNMDVWLYSFIQLYRSPTMLYDSGVKNPKGKGFFTPEDGNDNLSRNVGKKLLLVAAY